MNSLRARLTLWFSASFLVVTTVFVLLTYQSLDLELRRKSWGSDFEMRPGWILRGSSSEEEVREIMAGLVRESLTRSLPLVLLSLLVGYWIARKSLRPIARVNQQLQAISPRTLNQRVQLTEADEEFRDLLRHLNDMLARLQVSFAEMSEYAARVAHELRTPLMIVRLKVEQSGGKIDPDLAEELDGELHRLTHVVDQSLLIAKADQGRLLWSPVSFDLSDMLTELVKDFHLLATDAGRRLDADLAADCHVLTDPKYCKQILHALLTNALTHGRGAIRVRLSHRRRQVGLTFFNQVRQSPRAEERNLGLGLRVVHALLKLEPRVHFRQHHGRNFFATSLQFPAATRAPAFPKTATAPRLHDVGL